MKKFLILFTCVVLLFVVGCSDDDDCATCSDSVTPMGFVSGSLYLNPQAYIDNMTIYGYGAVPPNIDSMTIGDSLLFGSDFFDYDYDEEYHENWWEVEFDEDGSNYMYEHGDLAVVNFYGDGKMSTSSFVILDADLAEVEIISPLYEEDTLASSTTPVTVTWNKKEFVEYYAIWLEFTYGDDWEYLYIYTYTADTTFTVDPSLYPDSLRNFYVNVTPFTGPDPITGASNVEGDYLTGKMYGFGWYDYTRIIGWYPAPAGVSGVSPKAHPKKIMSPSQIIDEVYKNAQ